jgi:cation:H+ antiporter
VSVLWLAAGLVLVVAGAELFFEAVLGLASRLRVSAFALTALLSGFELENLAAGIAANLHGIPAAAAGTFLGGTTFLALAVTGVGALVAPLDARIGRPALLWTAASALPMAGLAADGTLSRLDGGLLLACFAVAMTGLWRSAPAGAPLERRPPRFASLRLLGGLAVLTAGGELLGRGVRGRRRPRRARCAAR